MSTRETAAFLRSQVRPVAILKGLFYVGLPALLATGFALRTPKQQFLELGQRIDSTNTRLAKTEGRADTFSQRLGRIEQRQEMQLRLSCVDKKITKRDFQLVGLNCDALFRNAVTQAGRPEGGSQ